MKVKCITNLAKDLPQRLIDLKEYKNDTVFSVKINKVYIVYAVYIHCNQIMFGICNENYYYSPRLMPGDLFSVADGTLSKYWIYSKCAEEYIEGSLAIIAYPEWANNPFHFRDMVENETEEEKEQVAIFQKYKQLMDLEFPDPQIKEKASPLEGGWLMCPHCIDAWQPFSKDGMVICPNCKNIMHNPFYDKVVPLDPNFDIHS